MADSYDGYNGQVTIEGENLVIARRGMAAGTTFGKDQPPRAIPLRAIGGVRLKPAGKIGNGWLQVLIGDQNTPELGTRTASSNADTILFTNKAGDRFAELHHWLAGVGEKNRAMGEFPDASQLGPGGQVGRVDRAAERSRESRGKVDGEQQAAQVQCHVA